MRPLLQLMVITCMVLAGSGCQHALAPSLTMQEKFFSSLEPANPAVEQTLRRARYHQLAGQMDLALKELQAATQKDPQNVRLLNALGNCHDRLGDYTQAREHYEKILRQDPANQLALNNLGYSCYLAGDLVQAQRCFQDILAKNPDNTLARNNLGLVFCRQGKEPEALRLWQKTEGELSAREKISQVLAYLGKSRDSAAIALPATDPRRPESRRGSADKPEEPVHAPELARLDKKTAPQRQPAPVAPDDSPEPLKTSKATGTPASLPQKPQVTVEEVEMVVQPAAYTPPPLAEKSGDRTEHHILQFHAKPEKSVSGRLARPLQEDSMEPDPKESDVDTVVSGPQPRRWTGKRRPKFIYPGSHTVQKSSKPLQEYIVTGFTHQRRTSATSQEMPIF